MAAEIPPDPAAVVSDGLHLMDNATFWTTLRKFRKDKKNKSAFYADDPTSIPEHLIYSVAIIKVNRKGKRQKRALVLTSLALFNFETGKYKKFKRRINVADLDSIFRVTGSHEFVLHMWEHANDYDYRYDAESEEQRDAVIAAIVGAFQQLTGQELNVVDMSDQETKTVTITKAVVRKKQDAPSTHLEHRRALVSGRLRRASVIARGGDPDEAGAAGGAGGAGGEASTAATPPPPPGTSTPPPPATDGEQASDDPAMAQARALLQVVDSINDKVTDNPKLGETVSSMPRSSILDMSRLYAEMLTDKEMRESATFFLTNVKAWAETSLAGTQALLAYPGEIPDADFVRAWNLRSLWTLLRVFKKSKFMQSQIKSAGGFSGMVIAAVLERGSCISEPEYNALMEALVGHVTRPSDNSEKPELFGKKVEHPEVLPLVMRLIPPSNWPLRHLALKDINILLVKREENFKVFLQVQEWQTWAATLLAFVPRSKDARDEQQAEYHKFVMNLFAMMMYHIYSKGSNIDKMLNRLLDQLKHQVGWRESTAAMARSLLSSLLVKVGATAKRWRSSYDRPEWTSLFKVTAVIEDYIFYRPAEEAVSAEESQSTLLPFPERITDLRSPPEVLPPGRNEVDRKHVGIHVEYIPEDDGEEVRVEIGDYNLAKRVVSVLEKLGIRGDDSATDGIRDKKAIDRLNRANAAYKAYTEIVQFLQGDDLREAVGKAGDAEAEMRLVTKLAKFLEKRQKSRKSGFISKGQSKKSIMQALQNNVQRQQARRKIQSTIEKSKVARAKKAVIIEVDAEEEESSAQVSQKVRAGMLKAAAVSQRLLARTRSRRGSTFLDPAAAAGGAGGTEESKTDLDDVTTPPDEEDGTAVDADAVCARCENPLLDGDGQFALGSYWHSDCWQCEHCNKPFGDREFFERKGKAYCREDYLELFGRSVCAGCMKQFKKGEQAMEAVNKMWHPDHFCCYNCDRHFDEDETYFERDGNPYCRDCNESLFMTCPRCKLPVGDADDGVAAMGRNWHRRCFSCAECSCEFKDDTFYTKDTGDGRGDMPYCETDFVEKFVPKCRACGEAVMNKGVGACGQCWHLEHFVCHHCGDPFPDNQYFENDGWPYCERDYFDLFGERCGGCGDIIRDEVLNALGKAWHNDHFVCKICGDGFPHLQFYERDGDPYCERDYLEQFCGKCGACGEYVTDGGLEALGKVWHTEHLKCAACDKQLGEGGVLTYQGDDGKVYCKEDYMKSFGEVCGKCGEQVEGEVLKALDKSWHPACFTCAHCNKGFPDGRFGVGPEDGLPYCVDDFAALFGEKCGGCGKPVVGRKMKLLEKSWHPECVVCSVCAKPFAQGDKLRAKDGKLLCEEHFLEQLDKCAGCLKPITGAFLKVLGNKFHKECLVCFVCGTEFEAGKIWQREGLPVCAEHTQSELDEEAQAKLDAFKAYDTARKEKAAAAAAAAEAAAKSSEEAGGEAAPAGAPEGTGGAGAPPAPESQPAGPASPASAPPTSPTSQKPAPEGDAESNDPSAGLPDGWQALSNEEGDIFYYNESTGESVWEKPTA